MNNTHKAKWWPRIDSQHAVFALLLVLLTIVGIGTLVLASDVSDAIWRGRITISNNGASTTAVSVNMSLNSVSMIENGYASDNLADSTIQLNGVDTAFMPGVNATSPWVLFVPSISTGQNVNYDFYSNGVTGGKLRYFPGSEGMTTPDSASLELSDNFTIEQKGWVDTSAGSNGYLVNKDKAFITFVSGTDEISSAISTNNITQSAQDGTVNLYAALRTRVAQRYDSFPASVITSTSFYLKKTGLPLGTANATIRAVSDDAILATMGAIDVSTLNGTFVWYEFNSSGVNIPQQDIRIALEYASGNASAYIVAGQQTSDVTTGNLSLYDGSWSDDGAKDLTYEIIYGTHYVTATSISSGEHTVTTTSNQTHLRLDIDGNTEDTTSLDLENYITGEDGHRSLNSNLVWAAQTFTSQSSENRTLIGLKFYRVGSPGTVTVSVRPTAAGEPTGTDNTTGTIDGNTFTTSESGGWYYVPITTYGFPSGTQFAIVVRALSADGSNYIRWQCDNSNATYSGGSRWDSGDAGGSWAEFATRDFMFRLFSPVPDNSSNWTFLQNNGMPYMEYQDISVNGTQVQYIDWEYGTTFSDTSGYGNDATPTFRTTSSDADVSTELTLFQPVEEAQAPAFSLATTGGNIVTENLTTTGTFTETPSPKSFPFKAVIEAVAAASSTPAQLPFIILSGFVILGISLSVTYFLKKHGSGSLFIKVGVVTAIMGIFIALRMLDFWMLVLFLMIAVGLMVASKQGSYT